ncbi:hypothetical protein D9M71_828820 [compost metagenome]
MFTESEYLPGMLASKSLRLTGNSIWANGSARLAMTSLELNMPVTTGQPCLQSALVVHGKTLSWPNLRRLNST